MDILSIYNRFFEKDQSCLEAHWMLSSTLDDIGIQGKPVNFQKFHWDSMHAIDATIVVKNTLTKNLFHAIS
jgi:uncharacterized protein YjiS (DUF1127 family)